MKTGIVNKKKYEVDYEAGRGSLSIPILGDLFPNLWGPTMNQVNRWIVVVDNTEYSVGKDFYDRIKEGDSVEINDASGLSEIKRCKHN